MKTATGLTLIALGAVLAFAVNGHPWFLNLQVCGWIIMVIGVAGLAIPRSGYGWLRRQVVRRPAGSARVVRVAQRNPSYIALNPAAAGPDGDVVIADTTAMPVAPTSGEARNFAGEQVVTTEQVVPDEETVEEFFPE